MKKFFYSFGVVVLMLAASASLADAGGWAVVTLDQLPTNVVANQPLTVSFVVRQHGRTLLGGLSPKLTLNYSKPGNSKLIYAKPLSDRTGAYQAELVFPKPGTWTWSIDAFGAFPQPMPTLNVSPGAPLKQTEPAVQQPPAAPFSIPPAVGWLFALLGFAGASVAFVTWMRTSARAPFVLSLAAITIALAGGAFAALPARESTGRTLASNAQAPSAAEEAALDSAQIGRDLFLAKGCVVCHAHAAVSAERRTAGLNDFVVGPALTNTQRDTAYLHSWLKDPSAVKPTTEMPTLGLSDDEINALVKFLSLKSVQ